MVSQEILKKYADVLVKFALGDGGVKPNEVVFLQVPESAKPLLIELQKSVLECGANYIIDFIPNDSKRVLFEYGSDEQIGYYPKDYMLSLVETCDHFLRIDCEFDKNELSGIPPELLMIRQKELGFYLNARRDKESKGKMTWVIALYGTQAMADFAGLSLNDYWNQIIQACYLDYEDPIAKWTHTFNEMSIIKEKLNNLEIEYIHVGGEHSDLTLKIGSDRVWAGGTGRNIPTFEIFTSPDWRETNGWIEFNQPLIAYGSIITGIRLEFENGLIINATAETGEDLLHALINVENADKLGEFSLTDKDFSRITNFMGTTLYDENVGGKYGNTHVAIGQSFNFTYKDNNELTSKDILISKGFNFSSIHNDIVSTYDRTVTALLKTGENIVIYKNGKFTI